MRNPELLSAAQAAEALGWPLSTLHYRIRTGKVAATKVGDGVTSAYVIDATEIDRLKSEAAA